MTKRATADQSRTAKAGTASHAPLALPQVDFDDSAAGRVLAAAREVLLRDGYSGLTMDGLTAVLGMSKKTLYVHFASKDEMVAAIFAATGATIRRQVGELLDAPGDFREKLDGTLRIVGEHIGSLRPEILEDLQRFAPQLYAEINAIKARNIPLMLTRVLKLGVQQKLVRADVDVSFLIEYWVIVAGGLHDPALFARTGLTPRAAFNKALELFLNGALTSSGKAQVHAPR